MCLRSLVSLSSLSLFPEFALLRAVLSSLTHPSLSPQLLGLLKFFQIPSVSRLLMEATLLHRIENTFEARSRNSYVWSTFGILSLKFLRWDVYTTLLCLLYLLSESYGQSCDKGQKRFYNLFFGVGDGTSQCTENSLKNPPLIIFLKSLSTKLWVKLPTTSLRSGTHRITLSKEIL